MSIDVAATRPRHSVPGVPRAAASGLLVLAAVCGGCSIFNREGPDVSCGDLGNGASNACENGIIASCADGQQITYEVCTNEIDGVAAMDLCGASWQASGAFRCAPLPSSVTLSVASVSVTNHTTGLGQLRPGDPCTIHVYAKNTGTGIAESVAASFQSLGSAINSPECYLAEKTYCYDHPCACEGCVPGQFAGQDIEAGTTSDCPVVWMQFSLSQTTPSGPLDFGIVFFDSAGNRWPDTFQLAVQAP
jgi:hypothetical protein